MPANDGALSIDLAKWGDRAASPAQVEQYRRSAVPDCDLKPVAVSITADEVAQLFSQTANRFGQCNPNVFNQYILERLKLAGAPVEGTLVLKLAHGAVARVKSNPLQPQTSFSYMWLPAEYAVAIATGGEGFA